MNGREWKEMPAKNEVFFCRCCSAETAYTRVLQSRQQELKAYCIYIYTYTVCSCDMNITFGRQPHLLFQSKRAAGLQEWDLRQDHADQPTQAKDDSYSDLHYTS